MHKYLIPRLPHWLVIHPESSLSFRPDQALQLMNINREFSLSVWGCVFQNPIIQINYIKLPVGREWELVNVMVKDMN